MHRENVVLRLRFVINAVQTGHMFKKMCEFWVLLWEECGFKQGVEDIVQKFLEVVEGTFRSIHIK
jgi:hypothetical protein